MRCDLLSALTTTTTPSAWQLAAETCPLRRLMLERARESIAFQRRLRLWDQLPAQALRFSHGWGERETRVTGDWPQGTMGRVQTLSPSRLPLRAHRRETSGYEAAMRSYRIGLLFTHKNGDCSAISVLEGSCAAPISEVRRHISDWFRATLWCNVDRYSHPNGNE